MARVLTAPELAYLRTENQKSKLYLAILTPDTVYTARLNGVPTSDDEVAAITYDSGSGTPGDTRAGMSVYVGSSAGAYDKGSVRLREAIAAASGTMKVGELSDVDWTDNDYLTIVREFLLRPRHLRIDDSGVVYMDYDITFATPTYNPHLYPAPIPIIGPHAVTWLSGGSASVLFDASDSYTIGGAGAMTYAWSVEPSGTASWDDDTSATPTLTVTAADTYTVECTITWTYTAGSQAVSTTTYRHVFAFDSNHLPMRVFKLNSCAGDYETGGWSFSVVAYDEATRSEIRDRTLAVLFSVDSYGGTETSIGPLISGSTPIRENVIAWGWITGESIRWNPEQGTVTFDVQGPHHWLNLMEGFPSGIEDVDDDPDVWTEYKGLTPRAGTALFWLWRSTGPQVMDAFIFPDSVVAAGASPTALSEGSERRISVYDAPPLKLWRQISTVVFETVRAHTVCDRYGRLFIQRDLNEILEADRTAANAPTVMALTAVDWHDTINIERRTVSPVCLLDMSGVAYWAGSADPLFSLAPGHIFKKYGDPRQVPSLTLWAGSNKQALANTHCGVLLGAMNNEYPVIEIQLAANNRAFDIAPWQYATLTIAEGDTERGISGTFTIVPRRASFVHDPDGGTLLANVEFESESTPVDGITGDPPPTPPSIPVAIPPIPPTPPPPEPEIPMSLGCLVVSRTQIAVTFDFKGASPTWYDADPNGDISLGYFLCCLAYDNKAYVATTLGSLWYCSDLLAAADGTISWTEEVSGYGADAFRSMRVVDGEPFIILHNDPARAYGGEWGSLVLLYPYQIPIRLESESCITLPPDGSCTYPRTSSYKGYRQITSDGRIASSVYRAPNHHAALFPMYEYNDIPEPPALCRCTYAHYIGNHVGTAGFNGVSQSGRYFVVTGGSLRDSISGDPGPYGSWPGPELDTGVSVNYGVLEDTEGHYYYIKSNCLWRNGIEFAHYDEFNISGGDRYGGLFGFPNDEDEIIIWMVANTNNAYFNQHKFMIWYNREDSQWENPTGDIATALGTNTWDYSRGYFAFLLPEEDVP